MLEGKFKTELINEIKEKLPGCMIFHLDPQEYQGIPDLLVLYNNKWAVLEGKKSKTAHHQPNQEWYVSKMNEMSFGKFIFPENKNEVLDELERALKSDR